MQIRRSLTLFVLSLVVTVMAGCGLKTAKQVNNITVTCNTCIFPNGATGVEFAPSNQLIMDLTEGQVEQLSVTLLGTHGESLTGPDFPINYTTNDPAAISISPSGEVCGGVWDANYVVCRPGTLPRLCQSPVDPVFPPGPPCTLPGAAPTPTPGPSPTPDALIGITITSLNAGVTIHARVHPPIDKITLSATYPNASDLDPKKHCLTQSNVLPSPSATPNTTLYTMQFTPKAFNNGVDVTVDVGFFTWLISDPTVADISPGGLAISRASGVAYVTAAVDSPNGTFSEPFALVVCPIQSITLSPLSTTNAQNSDYALNPGDKVSWLANAIDTAGNAISIAPITFSSSQPATATFTSSGLIQGTLVAQAPGFFSIGAACSPPRCNGGPTGTVYTSKDGALSPQQLGFGFPIYSNIATGSVSGTSTSNVYVTGSLIAVPSPTAGPIPTPRPNTQLQVFDTVALKLINTVNLPYVPNSLVFDPSGSIAYIGTNDTTAGAAMVQLSPGSTTPIKFSGTITGNPNITNVTGKVLAVSPDGGTIIVSDLVNKNLFLVSKFSNSAQVFPFDGIRSASFSPDSSKAFLTGSSGVYVVSTGQSGLGQGIQKISGMTATVNSGSLYLPQGGAAIVSNVNGTNEATFSTCTPGAAPTPTPFASSAGLITLGPLVVPSPSPTPTAQTTTTIVGANTNGQTWEVSQATVTQPAGSNCTPAVTQTAVGSFPLAGSGAPASCTSTLTQMPTQLTALGNGARIYATGLNTAACGLPVYDAIGMSGGSVTLTPAEIPLAASATLDSNTLIVGTTDAAMDTGTLHLITTGAAHNPGPPVDTVQVSVPFIPSIVAVQPK